eukprot:scaffold4936_cov186-Skeletonema_dohrnii-CCMP3373.AAC.2
MAAAQDRTREWEAISHDIFMGRDPQKHHHQIPEEEDYDTDSTASDEYSDNDGFGYSSSPEYLAINLVAMIHDDQDDDHVDNDDANNDSWMQAALALSASINEVSLMIKSKSASYLNCTSDTFHIFFGHDNNDNDYADETTTSNADRSILETTVASFAAGMAKQIESLRQTVVVEGDHPFINSADDNNELDEATQRRKWANGPIGHRAGIASCLMQRLKSEIMDPMTTLTSQREKSQSRGNYSMDEPTILAQNPLLGFFSGATLDVTERSNHPPPPPAPWELGDHDPEQEKYERDQERDEFLRIYGETDNTPTNASSLESIITNTFPPPSVLDLLDTPQVKSNTQHDEAPVPKILSPPPPAVQQFKQIPDVMMPSQQHNEDEHMDQLQRESATLLATYQHSDLEGVQKVERSMAEITQLLSRFTDLITEQQEDIFMIHDQAIKSKENVDKGQDQLVDAVARGKKSTHPMASFIVLAAILLLLFNWITP